MDPRLARFVEAMEHLKTAQEIFESLFKENPYDPSTASLAAALLVVRGYIQGGKFKELADWSERMAKAGIRELAERN